MSCRPRIHVKSIHALMLSRSPCHTSSGRSKSAWPLLASMASTVLAFSRTIIGRDAEIASSSLSRPRTISPRFCRIEATGR